MIHLKKQTLKIAKKMKILKNFIFTFYSDLLKIRKTIYIFLLKILVSWETRG